MEDFIALVKKILIFLLALFVAVTIFRIIIVGATVALATVWLLKPVWISLIILYVLFVIFGKKKK